ncbi:MAG: glycosyltransferase family 9 protein [Cytophagaceae bacterium]
MKAQADKWKNYKNLLCIRTDNLGDIIMTSPAIRALKEALPGRKITLLASRAGSGIAKLIPEIDQIIISEPAWMKPDIEGQQNVQKLIEELKKHQYDAAVIFNVYSQNPLPAAMVCYMAGIPNIACYCRENPYHLVTDWIPDKEPIYEIKHEVIRQLDLVKHLGATVKDDSFHLNISNETYLHLHEKLNEFGINPAKDYIIIHPGVSEEKRQYPIQNFTNAAELINKKKEIQIIITGVESEFRLGEVIKNRVGNNVWNLAGKLNLEELVALIRMSKVLIANNTGPVHIAAAVKTPVVVLYALTNPQHAPWKTKYILLPFDVPEEKRSKNIIISYAYEKAFTNPPEKIITPEEVSDAALSLINNSKAIKKTEVLKL